MLQLAELAGVAVAQHDGHQRVLLAGRDQVQHRLAGQHAGREAENAFGDGVGGHDEASAVQRHDAVYRGVDHRGQLRLLLGQLAVGALQRLLILVGEDQLAQRVHQHRRDGVGRRRPRHRRQEQRERADHPAGVQNGQREEVAVVAEGAARALLQMQQPLLGLGHGDAQDIVARQLHRRALRGRQRQQQGFAVAFAQLAQETVLGFEMQQQDVARVAEQRAGGQLADEQALQIVDGVQQLLVAAQPDAGGGRVGQRLLHAFVVAGQLRRHAVEHARGAGELVVAQQRYLVADVAIGHALGRLLQRVQLTGQVNAQRDGEQRGKQQFGYRQQQAVLARLRHQLPVGGSGVAELDLAVTDAADGDVVGDGEQLAVFQLFRRGARRPQGRQRGGIAGLGQHPVPIVPNPGVDHAVGGHHLLDGAAQGGQVGAEHGVLVGLGEQLGDDLAALEQFPGAGVVQQRQAEMQQQTEHDHLDQRDPQYGFQPE
ncbi:hypothetical protein CV_1853 [Chromobacterium violaceum ATCC 12472]|uniref:Uncharacterized protein n=1 Tax=Chromobacterium violaceum (strain ATCC 12472 / DSM 30191 / JCM 1249 / CCUG 213 / NBRC 12614 / NCIMB 9131 / NCTC 9757 / MK) TaxID=243365 RepID=Q7NWX6_CHRVO|nr:hypothetical protein CV_1853 [Chromobacterium violaceum ATCC 12472]